MTMATASAISKGIDALKPLLMMYNGEIALIMTVHKIPVILSINYFPPP